MELRTNHNQRNAPVAKNEVTQALGARFREIRQGKKIWLRDFARKMGRSVNTIRWHEAGDRMLRADDLVKAATILGVDTAELTAIRATGDTDENSTNNAETERATNGAVQPAAG